jgi:hypothetical protein
MLASNDIFRMAARLTPAAPYGAASLTVVKWRSILTTLPHLDRHLPLRALKVNTTAMAGTVHPRRKLS